VFPSEIETVLMRISELAPHYQLIVDRPRTLDVLEVRVEARDGVRGGMAQALEERAARALRTELGLSAMVAVLPPHELPRSEGKALRLIDRRKGA
jgi:phenylacetate-CoA ligase